LSGCAPTRDDASRHAQCTQKAARLTVSSMRNCLLSIVPTSIGKAVEVGKRIIRPFDIHCSRHGLNSGVPQVSSQRTTSS
jgi:hypothetical protein